jgi:hypothetical protein
VTSKPSEQDVADAYVYALGRALVIRQEHMDIKQGAAAYNTVKYNPLGSADFVNPNLDVAYLETWFAVDELTPVLLEIPEIKGRYYTAQILDEWGEVIVNINERTFPSKPYGAFALVQPGTRPTLPQGASRVELHSCKAKMLARVELKDDREGAVRLQHAFKVTALGKPDVAPAFRIADFGNQDLLGAEIFDDVDGLFSSALDVAPNAAEMQQKARAVAAYAAANSGARATLDRQIREKIVPGFKEYAFTKSAPYRNHWVGGARTGNYQGDYRLRTTVNYAGIWANSTDEAIYFVATRDADDRELHGSNGYVIHFPANNLPASAVNGYWSVILVSVPEYRVVPNPLSRFNLNSYSPLKKEADGSLKIAVAPKCVPDVAESNWLPSPPGKPFSLTFRTYVPKDAVKRGDWAPQALVKVQ